MITFNLNASSGCTWILSDYLYSSDDFEGSSPPDIDTIKRLMVRDRSAYPSWYQPMFAPHPPLQVTVDGMTMYGYLCHLAPYMENCICAYRADGSRSVIIVCSDDCAQSLFYNQEDAIADAKRLDKATIDLREKFTYDSDPEKFLREVNAQGDEILNVIRELIHVGFIDCNDDIATGAEFAELFKQD